MRITDIYDTLCDLYAIRSRLDIERFLLLSRRNSDIIEIGSRLTDREALLIKPCGEGLELGLYIAPEIAAVLESSDPLDHMDEFACAAEGVSHFLYVVDRAEKSMGISQLEIELQGEVDKFLIINLYAAMCGKAVSPELFDRQFENHSFDPGLNDEELDRYKTASHFASKYCFYLRGRYFNPLRLFPLIDQARDFFGRGLEGKLSLLIP